MSTRNREKRIRADTHAEGTTLRTRAIIPISLPDLQAGLTVISRTYAEKALLSRPVVVGCLRRSIAKTLTKSFDPNALSARA